MNAGTCSGRCQGYATLELRIMSDLLVRVQDHDVIISKPSAGVPSYALLIEGKGSGMSLILNLVIIWRLRASGSMGRFSSNRDAKQFDLLKSHCLRN
jgi:hypothetical protein